MILRTSYILGYQYIFSSQELVFILHRTGDPNQLQNLYPHLERLSNLESNSSSNNTENTPQSANISDEESSDKKEILCPDTHVLVTDVNVCEGEIEVGSWQVCSIALGDVHFVLLGLVHFLQHSQHRRMYDHMHHNSYSKTRPVVPRQAYNQHRRVAPQSPNQRPGKVNDNGNIHPGTNHHKPYFDEKEHDSLTSEMNRSSYSEDNGGNSRSDKQSYMYSQRYKGDQRFDKDSQSYHGSNYLASGDREKNYPANEEGMAAPKVNLSQFDNNDNSSSFNYSHNNSGSQYKNNYGSPSDGNVSRIGYPEQDMGSTFQTYHPHFMPSTNPSNARVVAPPPPNLMGPAAPPSNLLGPGPLPSNLMGPGGPPSNILGPAGPPSNMMGPGAPPSNMVGPGPPPTNMMGPAAPQSNMLGPGTVYPQAPTPILTADMYPAVATPQAVIMNPIAPMNHMSPVPPSCYNVVQPSLEFVYPTNENPGDTLRQPPTALFPQLQPMPSTHLFPQTAIMAQWYALPPIMRHNVVDDVAAVMSDNVAPPPHNQSDDGYRSAAMTPTSLAPLSIQKKSLSELEEIKGSLLSRLINIVGEKQTEEVEEHIAKNQKHMPCVIPQTSIEPSSGTPTFTSTYSIWTSGTEFYKSCRLALRTTACDIDVSSRPDSAGMMIF